MTRLDGGSGVAFAWQSILRKQTFIFLDHKPHSPNHLTHTFEENQNAFPIFFHLTWIRGGFIKEVQRKLSHGSIIFYSKTIIITHKIKCCLKRSSWWSTLAYSVTVFHIFKIEKPCRHAEQPTAEKQRLWLREEVSRNKNNQGRGLKRQ